MFDPYMVRSSSTQGVITVLSCKQVGYTGMNFYTDEKKWVL